MTENRLEASPIRVFEARTPEEIMAVMRNEDEVAEQEKILAAMTPAFQEKVEYVKGWMKQELGHVLRARYELGCQVRDLYEDERAGGTVYGKNAIDRLSKLFRWDDGLLRSALRFAQAYTPEDVDRLCSLVLPTGAPLSWSHVRTLLAVDNPSRRQELLDKSAERGWSCTELAREVNSLADGSTKDGRGRPPKVPTDFDAAVAQQLQAAEEWDRRYTRVWSATDRSLVAQATKLPRHQVTDDNVRQARMLAAQLRRVVAQATEQANLAEKVAGEFEQILRDRHPSRKGGRKKVAAIPEAG